MTGLPFLRLDALMVCTHELGRVGLVASQEWLRIDGVPVLVDDDPEGRPISRCPNLTVATKPCTLTLKASAGYSDFIRIGGKAVCLSTVTGRTDGTGEAFQYIVKNSGQSFVGQAG